MLEATALAEDEHYWFKGLRRNARRFLTRALAGRPVALVVDCGTGTGRNLDWLAEFGPAVGVEGLSLRQGDRVMPSLGVGELDLLAGLEQAAPDHCTGGK